MFCIVPYCSTSVELKKAFKIMGIEHLSVNCSVFCENIRASRHLRTTTNKKKVRLEKCERAYIVKVQKFWNIYIYIPEK